jgi:hypothetical protein
MYSDREFPAWSMTLLAGMSMDDYCPACRQCGNWCLQSTLWDETVKICCADPDYHRRDMFETISVGKFFEWEFAVQLFTQKDAEKLCFDHLDATKRIPEEPLRPTTAGRRFGEVQKSDEILALSMWPKQRHSSLRQKPVNGNAKGFFEHWHKTLRDAYG